MKKAFTLAEVLITLAIMGVVAALTLPTILKPLQGDSEIIDNTQSNFTHKVRVNKEFTDEDTIVTTEDFSDNEVSTLLSNDINGMNLNSCKELVIRKYGNRMKIYCRR
jgi:prepilin-type N-terminal cleavage/methylation domain-containing protein